MESKYSAISSKDRESLVSAAFRGNADDANHKKRRGKINYPPHQLFPGRMVQDFGIASANGRKVLNRASGAV